VKCAWRQSTVFPLEIAGKSYQHIDFEPKWDHSVIQQLSYPIRSAWLCALFIWKIEYKIDSDRKYLAAFAIYGHEFFYESTHQALLSGDKKQQFRGLSAEPYTFAWQAGLCTNIPFFLRGIHRVYPPPLNQYRWYFSLQSDRGLHPPSERKISAVFLITYQWLKINS